MNPVIVFRKAKFVKHTDQNWFTSERFYVLFREECRSTYVERQNLNESTERP